MAREDYPYCISCDAKMSWVRFEAQTQVFYCECGEIVEVKVGLEDGEGLLPDSERDEGC